MPILHGCLVDLHSCSHMAAYTAPSRLATAVEGLISTNAFTQTGATHATRAYESAVVLLDTSDPLLQLPSNSRLHHCVCNPGRGPNPYIACAYALHCTRDVYVQQVRHQSLYR